MKKQSARGEGEEDEEEEEEEEEEEQEEEEEECGHTSPENKFPEFYGDYLLEAN